MANLLKIIKEPNNYFTFILNGDNDTAIKNTRNDLLTFGNEAHFKTSNGANLIKEQNVIYSNITIVNGASTLTPTSTDDLFTKLISVNFFDWINGTGSGGVDRFDHLLDTFSYFGKDGQTIIVDEAQLKLITVPLPDVSGLAVFPTPLVASKFLKVKADASGYEFVDAVNTVTQEIRQGYTETSPSEDAVYNAISLIPDFNNKLDKVSTVTENAQAYVKNASGNQVMYEIVAPSFEFIYGAAAYGGVFDAYAYDRNLLSNNARSIPSSFAVTNAIVASTTPDATTTIKGKLKLAGDLGGTSDLPTVPGLNNKINSSEKGASNGVATLGLDGKVPNSQIPALAISETFPVSSQAQMLALSGAEQGDIAIRSDISKSFILRVSPASTLGNWSELLTPTDAVTSVNGQVGVVSLTTANVPDSTDKRYQTDNQKLYNDATSSIQSQLNAKQSILTNPITGTGVNNYIPVFTGTGTIGQGALLQTGSRVSLGANVSTARFTALSGVVSDSPAIANTGAFLGGGNGGVAFGQYTSSVNSHVWYQSMLTDGTIKNLNINPLGGNVGIGTTNPVAKLTIRDGTNVSLGVKIGQEDLTAIMLNAFNDAGTANIPMEFRASKYNFSNGNIGIGTINPTYKLQVVGTGNFLQTLDVGGFTVAGNKGVQIIPSTDGTMARLQGIHAGVGADGISINSVGGNVLIGTTTDNGSKLQVNGTISTTGIFINTDTTNSATDIFNAMPLNSQKTHISYADLGFGLGDFYLESFTYSSDLFGMQRATYFTGTSKGKLYVRVKDSGTWSGWVEK